jgi:hypothetical protein
MPIDRDFLHIHAKNPQVQSDTKCPRLLEYSHVAGNGSSKDGSHYTLYKRRRVNPLTANMLVWSFAKQNSQAIPQSGIAKFPLFSQISPLKIRLGLLLLFLIPKVYASAFSITGRTAAFNVEPEFNRTFYQCWTFSGSGSLTFNERYSLTAGIALWNTNKVSELDAFPLSRAAFCCPWLSDRAGFLWLLISFVCITDCPLMKRAPIPCCRRYRLMGAGPAFP